MLIKVTFTLGGTPNSGTYCRQRFDLYGLGVLLHIFQNKSMYEFFGDIFYSLNIAILAPLK